MTCGRRASRATANNPSFCGDELGGFWGWAEFDRFATGPITGAARFTGCSHFPRGGGPAGAFTRTWTSPARTSALPRRGSASCCPLPAPRKVVPDPSSRACSTTTRTPVFPRHSVRSSLARPHDRAGIAGTAPCGDVAAAPGFRFQRRRSPAAKLPGNCRGSFLSKVLHARADLAAIGIRHGSGRGRASLGAGVRRVRERCPATAAALAHVRRSDGEAQRVDPGHA
jgi:hypothetical protein